MLNFFKKKPMNIQSGLLLFSLVPIFIIMCAVILFLSGNQVQKAELQAEDKFMRSIQEINVILNQAMDFSNNIIANQSIVDIFQTDYSNLDENFKATESLKMFFANYKEKPSSESGMIIYHNNLSMYRSSFSRYVSSLDKTILDRLQTLHVSDFLWIDDADNLYLYKTLQNKTLTFITEYTVPKQKLYEILNRFDVMTNDGYTQKNEITLSKSEADAPDGIHKTLANGSVLTLQIPSSLAKAIYLKNFLWLVLGFSLLALLIRFLSGIFIALQKSKLSGFIDELAGKTSSADLLNTPLDTKDVLFPVYQKIIQLISDVNNLHERNSQIMTEKNMIELKYIQSQFNPHLLYNTLGVLKWKCIKQSPALADVIDSMADYYRACIGGYDEIVTFSEELNLIQKYIALMEFTHERSYPTDYRIEKELLDFRMPKHLLQPFVENAILHGIQQKPSGYLQIEAKKENDYVVFKVIDNGNGIPPERLAEVESANYFSRYKSYGIKNTKERISIFYKGKAYLTIKSTPGEGTCVTLHIAFASIPNPGPNF